MKWFTCMVLILFGQSGGLAYSYDKKGVYPTSSQLPSSVHGAHCHWGNERVCATNGVENFLFDNPCELNAFNGRQLRIKQTVLLKTDLADCHPPAVAVDDKPYSYCPQFCNRIFSPICASYLNVQRNFTNECEMRRHICHTHENWQIVLNGTCVDASCPLDGQEVCAWYDHVQYAFPNLLSLYDDIRLTGRNWHILNVGPCPCPQVYKPICAQVNCTIQTYQNDCFLKRDIKNATYWNILFYGECPMIPFNVTNNCNANNTTTPAPGTSSTIIPTTPATNTTVTPLPDPAGNSTTANPNNTTTISPINVGNVTTALPVNITIGNNTTLATNCSGPTIIPLPNRRPVYIVRQNRILPYRLISQLPTYGKSSYTSYPSVSNGYGGATMSNAYDNGYGGAAVSNAYDNSYGGAVASGYSNSKYTAPTPSTYPNAGSGSTAVSGYHGSNYNAPTAYISPSSSIQSHKNTGYGSPAARQYSDYTNSKPMPIESGYSNNKYTPPTPSAPNPGTAGYDSRYYKAPTAYIPPNSGMQTHKNTGYGSPASSQYSDYTNSKPMPIESGYSNNKYTPPTPSTPNPGTAGYDSSNYKAPTAYIPPDSGMQTPQNTGYSSPASSQYSDYTPPKHKPAESVHYNNKYTPPTPSTPNPGTAGYDRSNYKAPTAYIPPNSGMQTPQNTGYSSPASSQYSDYTPPKPKPAESVHYNNKYTSPTPSTPNPGTAGYDSSNYKAPTPYMPPNSGMQTHKNTGYGSPAPSQYSNYTPPNPKPVESVHYNNKYTSPTPSTPNPGTAGYDSSNYKAPTAYIPPNSGMQTPQNAGYSSPASSQYSDYTPPKPKPVESVHYNNKYTPPKPSTPNPGPAGYDSPASSQYNDYTDPKPNKYSNGRSEKPKFYATTPAYSPLSYTPTETTPPATGGGCKGHASYQGSKPIQPKPKQRGYSSSNAYQSDVYEILKPSRPYASTTPPTKKPSHTQYYQRPSSVYIIKVAPAYPAPSGGSSHSNYNSQKPYGNIKNNRDYKNVNGDDDDDDDDESLT